LLLDAPTLAAVGALGLGAAVIGGLGGFGAGVILAAALAPLIGVKALVPVLAVAGVIINAGRFWFYRAHVDRAALAVMLAAALPLLVLGAWLYSVLDARVIGTILGLAVMGSVPPAQQPAQRWCCVRRGSPRAPRYSAFPRASRPAPG